MIDVAESGRGALEPAREQATDPGRTPTGPAAEAGYQVAVFTLGRFEMRLGPERRGEDDWPRR